MGVCIDYSIMMLFVLRTSEFSNFYYIQEDL